MTERKTRGPKTITVTISVDREDNALKCEPACATVRKEDKIVWQSAEGYAFAIHLGYDAPFDKVHHQRLRGQNFELDIPRTARNCRIKYSVAVFDGDLVWIEDPEVIIRPDY